MDDRIPTEMVVNPDTPGDDLACVGMAQEAMTPRCCGREMALNTSIDWWVCHICGYMMSCLSWDLDGQPPTSQSAQSRPLDPSTTPDSRQSDS